MLDILNPIHKQFWILSITLAVVGVYVFICYVGNVSLVNIDANILNGSNNIIKSIYKENFLSHAWRFTEHFHENKDHVVSFYVAMKLRNLHEIDTDLLSISDPSSVQYGKHLSIEAINEKYGPTTEEQNIVMNHFKGIKDSVIISNLHGDFFRVTAPVKHIESTLETELGIHSHDSITTAKVVRAINPIMLPERISELISFISLNAPAGHPKSKMTSFSDFEKVILILNNFICISKCLSISRLKVRKS
jgi:subtilase family serine protease